MSPNKAQEKSDNPDDGDNPDPRVILARMKETMDGVRRRQSIQPSTPSLDRHRVSADMDVDDVAEYFAPSSSGVALSDAAIVPGTPSFQGMREMFNPPIPSFVNTPALKGVRGLFKPEHLADGLQSPMLQGVEELLQPPVGWNDVEDSPPIPPIVEVKKKRGRGARTAPLETTSLADDEASPANDELHAEEEEPEHVKPGRVLRGGAGKKPTSVCSLLFVSSLSSTNTYGVLQTSLLLVPEKAAARSTRARSKTPQPVDSTDDEPGMLTVSE